MANVIKMMTTLGWEILEVRRSRMRLAICYNILHNITAIPTSSSTDKDNVTRRRKNTLTILQLAPIKLVPLQFLSLGHPAVECPARQLS